MVPFLIGLAECALAIGDLFLLGRAQVDHDVVLRRGVE